MLFRILAGAVLAVTLTNPAAAEFRTPAEGGPGGNPFSLKCPTGQWGAWSQTYLVGVNMRLGALMDYVELICALVDPQSVQKSVRFAYTLPAEAMPRPRGAGGTGGKGFYAAQCSSFDQVVTQLRVETASYLEKGQFKAFVADASVGCLHMNPPKDFAAPTGTHRVGAGYDKANYAWLDPLSCPPGQWAVGIHGRAGQYVDRLGLICDTQFQAPAAPPPMAETEMKDTDLIGQGSMFEESVDPNALQGGGNGMFEGGINRNAIGN